MPSPAPVRCGEKYEEQFRALNQLVAEHTELSTSEAALERELDLLRHQVHEIEAAQLRPDEEEELLARYSVAANSRRLLELSTQIVGRLTEADDALLPRLGELGKLLRDLERVDPAASRFTESHVRATAELEDLAQSLQRYAEDMDLDPERLAQMEERVTLFETLKRKYGGHIARGHRVRRRRPRNACARSSRAAPNSARLEKEIAAGRARRSLEAGAEARRETQQPPHPSSPPASPRICAISASRSPISAPRSPRWKSPARTASRASPSSSLRTPANRPSRSKPSPPAAKSRASCSR